VTSTVHGEGLPDGALARLVVQGGSADAAAAEAELCRRFARRVRLYGWRHLRRLDAAEDLAQRVLLLMLQKLRGGEVRDPDRIGAFVLGTARVLVGESRRRRLEVTWSDDAHQRASAMPDVADPLAAPRLPGCLADLPERERTVVVLTYYGEARARQIAEQLAIAEGHVRVLRHRALARLRRCLGEPRREGTA
jgi:RNA polymerase sigma-70 factor, ECF subfamily